MKANDIRRSFLEFFAARGHRVVRSSSLVPAADPTLLFTNAGMNQFKDVFLGLERRDYARAATSQKCLRVSGKHNDLENVGRTRRHHTFFEMLGNFSFGDYFKQEAIAFAWELMTQVWKLPAEKLYVTIFEGAMTWGRDIPRDQEAEKSWLEMGVVKERIFAMGMEDNFWAMGDTGPCGPCSEIHYDAGPEASEKGHKDCRFPCDCGRYVELWNLVFIQYDFKVEVRDGARSSAFTLLPKPCVDTGMGLERIATVMQGKVSNYDTDLFRPLIEAAEDLSQKNYGAIPEIDISLRIIADHSRAATFLISDGVQPSNERRGYVLRLIMRRALYHGQTLGLNYPFLYKISSRVVDLMKDAYPELLASANHIARVMKYEEARYAHTTRVGLDRLDETDILITDGVEVRKIRFRDWREDYETQSNKARVRPYVWVRARATDQTPRKLPSGCDGWLNGEDLFTLYDSFGMRPDFVEDVLGNYRLTVDREGYEAEMQRQRERARASWKVGAKQTAPQIYQQIAGGFFSYPHPAGGVAIPAVVKSVFEGYSHTKLSSCVILAIVDPSTTRAKHTLSPGETGEIMLDRTPFYAEAGGQVGDTGWLYDEPGSTILAEVTGCYHPVQDVHVHTVIAREHFAVGDRVKAVVDEEARASTMRNHTGTHLLHAALRQVLGPHVKQAGSLVAPDRLRFDFAHYAQLDPEELKEIERLANQQILRDAPVTEERMDLDAALKSGALAFFGDKYPEKNVRVITIPDPAEEKGFFSKELCGGTHVPRTGHIGVVKVFSESSVAAGVRRIEAVSGAGALAQYQEAYERLRSVAEALRVPEDEVLAAVERLGQQVKQLGKQLEDAKHQAAKRHPKLVDAANYVREVKGVNVLSMSLEDYDPKLLRATADDMRKLVRTGVVVLGSTSDGKVLLVVAVTKDLIPRLHAGKIAKEVAGHVGGTGGGRPDLAEDGGKDPGRLPQALEDVYAIVEKML